MLQVLIECGLDIGFGEREIGLYQETIGLRGPVGPLVDRGSHQFDSPLLVSTLAIKRESQPILQGHHVGRRGAQCQRLLEVADGFLLIAFEGVRAALRRLTKIGATREKVNFTGPAFKLRQAGQQVFRLGNQHRRLFLVRIKPTAQAGHFSLEVRRGVIAP